MSSNHPVVRRTILRTRHPDHRSLEFRHAWLPVDLDIPSPADAHFAHFALAAFGGTPSSSRSQIDAIAAAERMRRPAGHQEHRGFLLINADDQCFPTQPAG